MPFTSSFIALRILGRIKKLQGLDVRKQAYRSNFEKAILIDFNPVAF
jgi:hypothetical protein